VQNQAKGFLLPLVVEKFYPLKIEVNMFKHMGITLTHSRIKAFLIAGIIKACGV
jgi:hypothetical protein